MLLLLLLLLLLDYGSARQGHVLAESEFFPLKENANSGAFRAPQRTLHLLARGELHIDEIDFKNGVADADETAFGGRSCGFQARYLVEAIVTANKLYADPACCAFDRNFHKNDA